MDDAALIKLALQRGPKGDAAFAKLYEKYWPKALRVAASKVGKSDAEDVAMIAMTSVSKNLAKYSGTGSFEGWLVRITQNAAMDELRKRKNRRETAVEDIEGAADDFLLYGADGHAPGSETEPDEEVLEPVTEPRKPDEFTPVPINIPGIAAIMFLAALAWPETTRAGHRHRDRVMFALASFADRAQRERGMKIAGKLPMTTQQQRNTIRLLGVRLQQRLDASSVAIYRMAGFKRPDLKPWSVGAAARRKGSRTTWYRDVWTRSLPVLHLAWKFRGVYLKRRYRAMNRETILHLVLSPTWVQRALIDAEKLAPVLPQVVDWHRKPYFSKVPALVRLIPTP